MNAETSSFASTASGMSAWRSVFAEHGGKATQWYLHFRVKCRLNQNFQNFRISRIGWDDSIQQCRFELVLEGSLGIGQTFATGKFGWHVPIRQRFVKVPETGTVQTYSVNSKILKILIQTVTAALIPSPPSLPPQPLLSVPKHGIYVGQFIEGYRMPPPLLGMLSE